jgi:hypothetical protein
LHKALQPFDRWVGEWAGKGTTKKNVPVNIRVAIQPRMAGETVEISVESLSAANNKLVHGVVALVSAYPDGRMRMAASSTIHGAFLLDMTPEDPGAVAFAGRNVIGEHVVVSFLQDGNDLMLTAHWKADVPGNPEPVGVTNCRLRRVTTDDE